MKYALALLLCWSSLLMAEAAPSGPVPLTMVWNVRLDASGTVTDLQPVDERVPQLYKRFDAAIRSWHFTSGKVNGVPQPTETTLWVHVSLEPIEGGYRARVVSANTGPRYGLRTAPKYPDSARDVRRGGAVMLVVHYDANGNVIDATPEPGGTPKPRSDIEHAAVSAVKHWTFKPEVVGGHGIAGMVKVPLCFSVGQSKGDCTFREETSHQALDPDTPFGVDSVVKLETDVADRTL